VFSGLEFLFPIRAVKYCAPNVKLPDVAGKAVAVIGAGHSAVDVAHNAIHLGAAKVFHIYRRTSREAPCGAFEIEQLQGMGAQWMERTCLRVLGANRVVGLEISRRPDAGKVVLPVDCRGCLRRDGLAAVCQGDWSGYVVRVRSLVAHDAIEYVFVAGDALRDRARSARRFTARMRAARSLANCWIQNPGRLDDMIYDLVANELGFGGRLSCQKNYY
jgi:glutamate synthase (NADPH/NADH) small chain